MLPQPWWLQGHGYLRAFSPRGAVLWAVLQQLSHCRERHWEASHTPAVWTARRIWSGKMLPPTQLEPAWAWWVPGSRFKLKDSCRVRTVILLHRNTSCCYTGILVAILSQFILLNYHYNLLLYTEHQNREHIHFPQPPQIFILIKIPVATNLHSYKLCAMFY